MSDVAASIQQKIDSASDEDLLILGTASDVRLREAARDRLAAKINTFLDGFSDEELIEAYNGKLSVAALVKAEIKKRKDAQEQGGQTP